MKTQFVKITRHGQMTLPKEIRDAFHVGEGDYMQVDVREDEIVLKPRKSVMIDPDQAYFWKPDWQKSERKVDANIKAGLLFRLDDPEDLLRKPLSGHRRLTDEELGALKIHEHEESDF